MARPNFHVNPVNMNLRFDFSVKRRLIALWIDQSNTGSGQKSPSQLISKWITDAPNPSERAFLEADQQMKTGRTYGTTKRKRR